MKTYRQLQQAQVYGIFVVREAIIIIFFQARHVLLRTIVHEEVAPRLSLRCFWICCGTCLKRQICKHASRVVEKERMGWRRVCFHSRKLKMLQSKANIPSPAPGKMLVRAQCTSAQVEELQPAVIPGREISSNVCMCKVVKEICPEVICAAAKLYALTVCVFLLHVTISCGL